MPVETPTFFAQVIQDHLDLKQRNAALEPEMPIERYKHEDPFHNHPLFKTEEQARLEETMDGEVAAPTAPTVLEWHTEDTEAHSYPELEDSFWNRSRDFDWGD